MCACVFYAVHYNVASALFNLHNFCKHLYVCMCVCFVIIACDIQYGLIKTNYKGTTKSIFVMGWSYNQDFFTIGLICTPPQDTENSKM